MKLRKIELGSGTKFILGKDAEPFGKVIYGFGNNGSDQTEGVVYKNSIGSYLHGPILSKNPELADYLIEKALFIRYKSYVKLEPLNNSLEEKAKEVIVRRCLS